MEILKELQEGPKIRLLVKKDEGGLFIVSENISISCAFLSEECNKFVEAVKEADRKIKKKRQ